MNGGSLSSLDDVVLLLLLLALIESVPCTLVGNLNEPTENSCQYFFGCHFQRDRCRLIMIRPFLFDTTVVQLKLLQYSSNEWFGSTLVLYIERMGVVSTSTPPRMSSNDIGETAGRSSPSIPP